MSYFIKLENGKLDMTQYKRRRVNPQSFAIAKAESAMGISRRSNLSKKRKAS